MKTIGFDEVLVFHRKLIEKTGGATGVRDYGLIESALNKGLLTFDGEDLYKSIEEKITAIIYALIKNHGFVDGNKRIGIAVMLLLLKLNEINIFYTQEELVNLGLGIAEGLIKENDIRDWIKNHLI